jgi:RNA-binding protein YhbY
MSEELERIGRLMLYRNRILEKLLREIEKEFPNMEVIVEEFERLLEAIDDLDNETIHTIAKLKESKPMFVGVTDEKEKGEEVEGRAERREQVSFEDWFVEVLNALNGSDSMKNYVLALKQMGGVALSSKIVGSLGLKRNTISEIEGELEKRRVIESINIAGRKLVFFNHPEFTTLTARELVEKLEMGSE